MPRWLGRALWAVRGKRRVRLHMVDRAAKSVEGILQGRWGGHYVLLAPQIVDGDRTYSLTGHLEVPAERVLFVQVYGGE